LKKKLATLGLIILVIGLGVAIWAGTFRKKVVLSTKLENDILEGSRTSGSFDVGNRLNITISPNPTLWFAEPKNDEYSFSHLEVDVSITDPKGGKTNFTVIFAQEPNTLSLQFFIAKLVSNDGGLIIEEENIKVKANTTIYCSRISGIVAYNGTYSVVVGPDLPAPHHIYLYKQEIAIESPYLYAVPISMVFIAPGIVLLTKATRKPKRRMTLKNKDT
jgi:hypothetical protein